MARTACVSSNYNLIQKIVSESNSGVGCNAEQNSEFQTLNFKLPNLNQSKQIYEPQIPFC